MRKISRLVFLLLLPAAVAIGATHNVLIGDDCPAIGECFWPTPLTIQAGDSVTFKNYNSNVFHGPHNVVADDGSFRCALGCDGEGGDGSPRGQSGVGGVDLNLLWSFTRTFNAPGVVTYHDEVSHASGAIVVQGTGTVAQVQTAVEYGVRGWWDYGYSAYFVTSSPDEIAALDGGAFNTASGSVFWERTGLTFNVWSGPGNGALPACRFFYGNSIDHFYTPYVAECAWLQAEYGWRQGWQYEGMAFYLQVPDGDGNCPIGTTILYRLYNDSKYGAAPLHRLTTDATTFNQMRAAGWVFEGNAGTFAFACAPLPPT